MWRVLGDDCAGFDRCISYGGWGRHGRPVDCVQLKASQIDYPLDCVPERAPLRQFRQWLRARPAICKWEERVILRKFQSVVGHHKQRMLVCPQDQLSVRLVEWASQAGLAEYVTWVMDDHELTDMGGQLGYDRGFARLWEQHLQRAHHVFVISDAMKSFYAERFGVESVVLHGAIPKAMMSVPVARLTNGPLKLGYAGSVFGWQEDPLRLLAESLAAGHAELHYAGSPPSGWLRSELVHHHGRLAPSDAVAMLRGCDAAVLPMSFRPEYTSLSRLNIATKLSELCALGIPILAIGPADAAMITQLSARRAAVCVSEPTVRAVVDGISSLRCDGAMRECVARALSWFEEELNLEEMQRRWRPISQWLFEN